MMITPADMLFAAEWMRFYEGDGPDDSENVAAAKRIAAWLDAEADRRESAAIIRSVFRRHGPNAAKAVRAMMKGGTPK